MVEPLRECYANFKIGAYSGQSFGPEAEYSARDIKTEFRELLKFLERVGDKENAFVALLSFAQREHVRDMMTTMINDPSPGALAQVFDQNKEVIRRLRVAFSSRRNVALQERAMAASAALGEAESKLEEVTKVCEETSQDGKRITEMRGDVEGLVGQLEDVKRIRGEVEQGYERVKELKDDVEAVAGRVSEIEGHGNAVENVKATVEASAKRVAALQKGVEDFSEKLEEREDQLRAQSTATEEYRETLKKFEAELKERKEKFEETVNERQGDVEAFVEKNKADAEEILKKAEEALGLGTGAGLAGAFHARVKELRGASLWVSWLWVALAISSAVAAIYLAVHFAPEFGQGVTSFWDFLARIGITALPVSILLFSLHQYSRGRNISEDYYYKAVLAQSIVGFLNQFKDEGERTLYLRALFRELFQDPLRKKHDPVGLVDSLVGTLKKEEKKPEEQDTATNS